MKCQININMDNTAFEEPQELVNILKQCETYILDDNINNTNTRYSRIIKTLRDSNGNTVGEMIISNE